MKINRTTGLTKVYLKTKLVYIRQTNYDTRITQMVRRCLPLSGFNVNANVFSALNQIIRARKSTAKQDMTENVYVWYSRKFWHILWFCGASLSTRDQT